MRVPPSKVRHQCGVMLLEALVAILIFSIGILALVGLQATAIKQSTDARLRSDAATLANDIIAEMWVSNRDTATLEANFEGAAGAGGARYNAWAARVGAALPGATGATAPTITIDPVGTALPGRVFVTVFWRAPNEPPGTTPHQYVASAVVR